VLAGPSSCGCHPALTVVCSQGEPHPAIPESKSQYMQLITIYMQCTGLLCKICKHCCKHSIILNTIPQVEALQGRPMYHVTSRGRREENIPFTNMITPNCLQYIT